MSHYFSRIQLRSSGLDSRKLARMACADAYREHQTLWRLFAEDAGASRDFLFRREQREGKPAFYLVSSRLPVRDQGIWRIEHKPYRPRVRAGQRLAFSLRANPVVTRTDADGKRRRHDVVMDRKRSSGYQALAAADRPALSELIQDAGLSWLGTRAERCGFRFDPSQVRVDGYTRHRLTTRKGAIHISTLDFNGVLEVTDEARFALALTTGIGPAKAFGCGLLLVRPLA